MDDALIYGEPTITLDETHTMTVDELELRFHRATRLPGELHVGGRPIARIRWHFPDRQTPALPIIVWR